MKPLLFRIPKTETESFRVQVDDLPYFYDTLHFHPEWQITLILESAGTQFVGDNVERFQPFDVYFLGSNLPHVFRNDAEYYAENQRINTSNVETPSLILIFSNDRFLKFIPLSRTISKLVPTVQKAVI